MSIYIIDEKMRHLNNMIKMVQRAINIITGKKRNGINKLLSIYKIFLNSIFMRSRIQHF